MTDYVLGFAFDENIDNVILIEKLKPEWQKGKLNGVGGHIELGEAPMAAMIREFQEETGIETTECDWHKFSIIRGVWGEIHIYRCILHERFDTFKSLTDEVVGSYNINYLLDTEALTEPPKMQSNMYWLLPMATTTTEQFVILETKL